MSCTKDLEKAQPDQPGNLDSEVIKVNKTDIVFDYFFHTDTITVDARGSWVADVVFPPGPLDRWMSVSRMGSDSTKLVIFATDQIRQTIDLKAVIVIRLADNPDTIRTNINVVRSAISNKVFAFGGEGDDAFNSLVTIGLNSEAVAAGYSTSSTGDLAMNRGGKDFWLLKLNYNGTKIWSRSFGGSGDDVATAIARSYKRVDMSTFHDGYIVAGYTYSNDGDVSGNHGGKDAWIIKTDTLGNIVWQKTLGGPGDDEILGISEGANPNLLLSGVKGGDQWMMRINEDGDVVWEKTFGSSALDHAGDVRELEFGLAFTGSGTTADGDVPDKPTTSEDTWLVKTTPEGDVLWKSYIAGEGVDRGVLAGGSVLFGNTTSSDIFPDFDGTQNIFQARFDSNDGHLLSKKTIKYTTFDELRAITGTRHSFSSILVGRSLVPRAIDSGENSLEGSLIEIDGNAQVISTRRTGGPGSVINRITSGSGGQSIFVGSTLHTDDYGNAGRSGWFGWIECK